MILMQILHGKITYQIRVYAHGDTPKMVTVYMLSSMPFLGLYTSILHGIFLLDMLPIYMRLLEQRASPAFC